MDASDSNLLAVALAFLPVAYLSHFLHEAGHAVIGRLCDFRVTSFGLGTARPFLVVECRGTKLYLARTRPFQGLTFWYMPAIYPTRPQLVWSFAGGLLVHAALLLLGLALWSWLPGAAPVWIALAVVNGGGLVGNAVPFSFRIGPALMRNDGMLILRTVRDGLVADPAPARISLAASLAPLWEAIGDYEVRRILLQAAALGWLELCDLEEAERLLTQSEVGPESRSPFQRAFAALVRASVDLKAERPEHAAAALAEAERQFGVQQHAAGLFLCRLARAELLLAQGEAGAAAQEFNALAAHPVAARAPTVRTALLESRIRAHVALGDVAEAARLGVEYAATPKHSRTCSLELLVRTRLARLYDRAGLPSEAATAYRCALDAARKVLELLGRPEDRGRFTRSLADLPADAERCFLALGLEADALSARELFASPEEADRKRTAAGERRNRRRHRFGMLLSSGHFILAFVLIALGVGGSASAEWQTVFVGLLLLAPLLAFAYGVILWPLCRFIPALRRESAFLTLVLALMPWLGLIVLAVRPVG